MLCATATATTASAEQQHQRQRAKRWQPGFARQAQPVDQHDENLRMVKPNTFFSLNQFMNARVCQLP